MLKRILTAVVALLLLLPILIWGGEWGAVSLFALISGFSVFEMLGCCGLRKNILISFFSIAVSVGAVFLPIVFHIFGIISIIVAVVACSLVFLLFLAVFMHKTVDIERLLMFFSLLLYITAGFVSLSVLRITFGMWPVAFVLCVSWCTDTFAYFSGMLFGNRKLCPDISPKKTIAGAIGGTLFGTLGGLVVFLVTGRTPVFALCALPLSVASQLGDLAASVIKRRFGIKDYGKIFPGHGGVLDRFDSIIPVSILTCVLFMGYWVYVWLL